MSQLAVSDRITEENKRIGTQAFGEAEEMIRECLAGGPLKDQPLAFGAAIFSAIAETTMDFIAREPARAEHYTRAGFEAWRAVAK
jgi:hypothetical protein